MTYEPYKMDAFSKLMMWAYNKGWYSGRKELVKITMLGEFEGFTGRASESWEHLFVVNICDIPELNVKAYSTHGETLELACKAMLMHLENEKLK